LLKPLGPAGLLEPTSLIALANFMARSNVAMGIESQEFSATCDLKLLASELARRTPNLCSKTWSNHSTGIELRAVTIVRLGGIGLATESSRLLERSSDRAHDRF
jgi:hypothetical protein